MKPILELLARAVVVLIGTAVITFTLLWQAPGDPALTIAVARYETAVSADVVEQIREESGLDAGFWNAFWHWIKPLLSGDFGNSSVTGGPIWPELVKAILLTLPLALSGLAIGLLVSIPLSIIAVRNPGGWLDRGAVALASLGAAMPAFWLALLLVLLFAVKLQWLPAMGTGSVCHLILPSVTLGLGIAASLTRILRSSLLEAKGAPFLPAFARRGVGRRERAISHIAPHSAIPVITVVGLELAFLLEGTVMIEVIFSRPGLGGFLIHAIQARDFPKVQAVVLLIAVLFVTINLLTDLIYRLADPRIGVQNA